MPVSSEAVQVPGTTSQVRSMAWLWTKLTQPGLVGGVGGRGQQAGGDEDQHEAGEPEEARQVERTPPR